jgi:hypothetical protein
MLFFTFYGSVPFSDDHMGKSHASVDFKVPVRVLDVFRLDVRSLTHEDGPTVE